MSNRAERLRPERLGIAMLATIAVAVTLGGGLWPYSPERTLEPAVAGGASPGTRVGTLALADGRLLAAAEIVRDGPIFRLRDRRGERTIAASQVADGDPIATLRFWLGSDRFGRDVAARLLHGGRISLAVAAAAIALALVVGVPYGLATGLARGAAATLLSSLLDAAQAFPRAFLVVALAALAAPSLGLTVLILGLTGWMSIARIVGTEARRLATSDFVLAARAAGAGRGRIAFRHLLPNLLAPIGVEASLGVASAVAAEAALAFLGLGAPPPTASWGNLIADGRDLLSTAPWISVAPGLALAMTVLGANLVAEGLANRLDPRRAVGRS